MLKRIMMELEWRGCDGVGVAKRGCDCVGGGEAAMALPWRDGSVNIQSLMRQQNLKIFKILMLLLP